MLGYEACGILVVDDDGEYEGVDFFFDGFLSSFDDLCAWFGD